MTELTTQNTDQVVVEVKHGTLLMFPSYLLQSVAPNESEMLRISVSFNIMFSSFAENLARPLWQPGAATLTVDGKPKALNVELRLPRLEDYRSERRCHGLCQLPTVA